MYKNHEAISNKVQIIEEKFEKFDYQAHALVFEK